MNNQSTHLDTHLKLGINSSISFNLYSVRRIDVSLLFFELLRCYTNFPNFFSSIVASLRTLDGYELFSFIKLDNLCIYSLKLCSLSETIKSGIYSNKYYLFCSDSFYL